MRSSSQTDSKWYSGITRYQWFVLFIASAGWVFDVYEGQIFNTTRLDLLNDMVQASSPAEKQSQIQFLGDLFLGIFLAGGMTGGLLFGVLGDRWGRRPTMVLTILMYSLFSGLTYFAQNLWHVGILRFLVSMGIGGEWAIGAALVSEVFPQKARAQAGAIFHGSSMFGTWLAGIVALIIGSQWRYGYLVGILPALLILLIRTRMEEPEAWLKVQAAPDFKKGSLRELFGSPQIRARAICGLLLASVGLATYWGVVVAGQDLARSIALAQGMPAEKAAASAKFAYALVQATGAGIGLVLFGPFCHYLGRRKAFSIAHLLAVAIVPVVCFLPKTYNQLLLIIPFYGLFTTWMHAGYAIYLPELFPTRLRALGTSFCFNGGRLLAAVMLPLAGLVKGLPGITLPVALSLLSLIYLLGLVVIQFLPETADEPLPE